MNTLPDPEKLIEKLELTFPIIGIYDAPDPGVFEPLVEFDSKEHRCVFKSYEDWVEGKTLHLTRENSGCGGCAYWLLNKETRTREDLVANLVDTEGLKDSKELMNRWLDHERPYAPQHPNICIGPLRKDNVEYLKTVTFLVNADQLSLLVNGANYFHAPDDPLPPVTAPFGTGCMQVLTLFKDLDYPQAVIGATDIAMRQCLPPGIVLFSVTLPMYRLLCLLDERSFLYKPFLENLKKTRGGIA